jgi:DNA-binding XRE family transcriptional regulator
MGRDVLQHLKGLRERSPEIQREYERLTPRYNTIRALVAARIEAEISQAELARRMGVSRAVVSRLESGEHDPKLDTLVKAAGAIGCEVDVRFVKATPKRARDRA